jgi:hypothetical protein
MPLHDWSELSGWEGMHLLWMSELLRHVKAKLPQGLRAYLGTGPAVAVGAPQLRPDVGVREHNQAQEQNSAASKAATGAAGSVTVEPDVEVAVAAIDPAPALFVERDGRLVSAIELVSPRNKDRPVARATYLNRYAGYLIEGIHLLLVDVHRRPAGFSFADGIATELQMDSGHPLPPPLAVSYRVGEPAATGGRMLAIWRRPLGVGLPLPSLPLALAVDASIDIDLDSTYMRAAADAYLA